VSSAAASAARSDGFWLRIIYIVSALVSGAVAFLILGPRPESTQGALDVTALPTVNASLNALTTVLLVGGWLLVRSAGRLRGEARRKRLDRHRGVMLTAFATSSAFLVSYVIYHWFKEGPKSYVGDLRALYLVVLFSHIVLAAAIVPLALVTLYRGWSGTIEKHRRIARFTLPLWLYVSVTGVVIYAMLYL
jgi:putative membrane protein